MNDHPGSNRGHWKTDKPRLNARTHEAQRKERGRVRQDRPGISVGRATPPRPVGR